MHDQMTREEVIRARWLYIIVLTAVACTIYFLSRPFLEPYISKFLATVGFYPIRLLWFFYFLIFAMLWVPVVRYGGFSIYSYLKYPPFWLAGIIGSLIILFFQQCKADY